MTANRVKANMMVQRAFTSGFTRFDDVDMVIPLVPVNSNIPHHNVVPWLLGQPKGIYEFFNNAEFGLSSLGALGEKIRNIIIRSDSEALQKKPRR